MLLSRLFTEHDPDLLTLDGTRITSESYCEFVLAEHSEALTLRKAASGRLADCVLRAQASKLSVRVVPGRSTRCGLRKAVRVLSPVGSLLPFEGTSPLERREISDCYTTMESSMPGWLT